MATRLEPQQRVQELQTRIEGVLSHWLPAESQPPGRLHAAMRYAVLGGGKRVRPLLSYAAGLGVGAPLERIDGPAAAVELIHAYSLVHDDLPAMDDDDLRRGRPTCHRAFDEAMAILAGDAIQALAFHILAHDPSMNPAASVRLEMIDLLAVASGSRGMAGGQAIDLDAVGQQLDIAQLENMHIHKTGSLIRASVLLGAMSTDTLEPQMRERLDRYGKCIGLAFQIRDDILDVEGDTAVIGKAQGADQALNKPTFPSVIGLDASREQARTLCAEAQQAIEPLGAEADLLRWIADYIVTRIQ
jgi:farnesyl diphosphate synthase